MARNTHKMINNNGHRTDPSGTPYQVLSVTFSHETEHTVSDYSNVLKKKLINHSAVICHVLLLYPGPYKIVHSLPLKDFSAYH